MWSRKTEGAWAPHSSVPLGTMHAAVGDNNARGDEQVGELSWEGDFQEANFTHGQSTGDCAVIFNSATQCPHREALANTREHIF